MKNKIIITVLCVALIVIGGQMLNFRYQKNLFVENDRWSARMSKYGLYDDGKVLILGDSQASEYRIAKYLAQVIPTENIGEHGTKFKHWVGKLQQIIDKHEPICVVQALGGNDVATGSTDKEILGNLEYTLKLYKQNNVKVMLFSLFPMRDGYAEKRPAERLIKLNKEYKRLAGEYGAELLDVWPVLSENNLLREDLTNDGGHLNDKGYVLLTKYLFPKLVRLL